MKIDLERMTLGQFAIQAAIAVLKKRRKLLDREIRRVEKLAQSETQN
jgi:hypothetical protein